MQNHQSSSNDHATITGKTFKLGSGGSLDGLLDLSNANGRTYKNCIFEGGSQAILHGKCGKGVVFDSCIFRDIDAGQGGLIIYPGGDMATSNDNYGLVFKNNEFVNCKAGDIFELKCSGTHILDNHFKNCTGGIRIRHGVGSVVCGNTGLASIKVRCGPHEVHDNKDSDVLLWAGNLPGPFAEWSKVHVAGGGHNMQCAWQGNFSNNKSITVGEPTPGVPEKHPAEGCNIDPNHPHYQEKLAKNITRHPCKRPA